MWTAKQIGQHKSASVTLDSLHALAQHVQGALETRWQMKLFGPMSPVSQILDC